MKFETYIQPQETAIWAKYAENFKDCNSIFETHFNGIALLQIFEKENDKDFLILQKVTKLFNCEKKMYDWSYYSLCNIISENCRVIRENVIANYPPQEIGKWAFKIDTRMMIEALYYACV